MQINNIYHITYYYKQSTKLLEIHKLSKQYLLHRICVLSLSVMTVLANAWHTKLLLNALQCSCWLKMMTTLSLSCWQEWHNYCHSWNIDCVITNWLTHLLRLRTSSLHQLAHFDTIIQHVSFYEVTCAKHTMALLTWIHSVFITSFLSCYTICYFGNSVASLH